MAFETLFEGTNPGDVATWDGEKWVSQAPAPGGLELIEEHTFSHGDTSYTFSGLDGDVDKIYKVMGWLQFHETVDTRIAFLQVNNDVTSIWLSARTSGGSWTGGGTFGDKGFALAFGGWTKEAICCFDVLIFAKTGIWRKSVGDYHFISTDGSVATAGTVGSTYKNSITNITSLLLKLSGDTFAAGIVGLYKI